MSPYCDQYGGAVLNATIDMYAYATIEMRDDGKVTFVATDVGDEITFPAGPIEMAGPLILHRAVYNRIVRQFNDGRPLACRVTTFCDAPPGSGLGTSSTVVVALVRAYAEWLNLPLGEYEIAHLAFEIERQDAALMGGRQDQYAAAFGGVNFMEFEAGERVIVNPLRVKSWILAELETSLLIFDSGVSRSSASIIAEQSANIVSNERKPLEATHELKRDAYGMKESLLKGNFDAFGNYMRRSWEAKKSLASSITTQHIDTIYDAAMEAGAVAGKVSGAGGGGFVTFLVNPLRRIDVIRALERQSGRVVTCHFTSQGAEAWNIY